MKWGILAINDKLMKILKENCSNKLVVVDFGGLFGHVLEVFLPNVSPVSVASTFRGQESELCLCSFVLMRFGMLF